MWYKRIQEDYEDEMEEFDKLPRNPNYRPKDNHERETQEEANERERRRLVEQRRGRYGGGGWGFYISPLLSLWTATIRKLFPSFFRTNKQLACYSLPFEDSFPLLLLPLFT